MSRRQQFCTFVLDGRLFGVEVEHVQEIIRYQEMTRIPHAPKAVAGLINLRGEIVPAVDLRHCLRLPERDADQLPTNVVMRTRDGATSFLVDDIGDVLDVAEELFEPPPENLRGALRDMVRGVFKLGDGLMTVLSAEAALETATGTADSRGGGQA